MREKGETVHNLLMDCVDPHFKTIVFFSPSGVMFRLLHLSESHSGDHMLNRVSYRAAQLLLHIHTQFKLLLRDIPNLRTRK